MAQKITIAILVLTTVIAVNSAATGHTNTKTDEIVIQKRQIEGLLEMLPLHLVKGLVSEVGHKRETVVINRNDVLDIISKFVYEIENHFHDYIVNLHGKEPEQRAEELKKITEYLEQVHDHVDSVNVELRHGDLPDHLNEPVLEKLKVIGDYLNEKAEEVYLMLTCAFNDSCNLNLKI